MKTNTQLINLQTVISDLLPDKAFNDLLAECTVDVDFSKSRQTQQYKSVLDLATSHFLQFFTVIENKVHLDDIQVKSGLNSESEVQRACITMVKRCFPGCGVWHTPNENSHRKGGILGGVSDLTVTWRGNTAYVELKDDDGKLSKKQKEFLEARALEGNHCAVFRSDKPMHDWLRSIGAPYAPIYKHKFISGETI